MKQKRPSKTAEQKRKQHNYDLIRRMRNGDALYSFDSQQSWYPPRPIVKKDKSEMSRLYEDAEQTASAQQKQGLKSLAVLPRPVENDDHQEVS